MAMARLILRGFCISPLFVALINGASCEVLVFAEIKKKVLLRYFVMWSTVSFYSASCLKDTSVIINIPTQKSLWHDDCSMFRPLELPSL